MKKAFFLSAACSLAVAFLTGCGKEPAAQSPAADVPALPEAVAFEAQPFFGVMSWKQRQVFRILETAQHLDRVLGLLQKLEAAGGLRLTSGAKPDLPAMAGTLALIRQETEADAADSTVRHPRALARLDALFTELLELEKQVDWPPDSPERKGVAAELVAASDVFETAEPSKSADEDAAPLKNW